jgi:hypothetical protein
MPGYMYQCPSARSGVARRWGALEGGGSQFCTTMKVRNNEDSLPEGNASPWRGARSRARRTCLVFPEKADHVRSTACAQISCCAWTESTQRSAPTIAPLHIP